MAFLLAPLLKRKRLPTALYAALAVIVFDDLYFTTIGGSPWRWAVLLPLAPRRRDPEDAHPLLLVGLS